MRRFFFCPYRLRSAISYRIVIHSRASYHRYADYYFLRSCFIFQIVLKRSPKKIPTILIETRETENDSGFLLSILKTIYLVPRVSGYGKTHKDAASVRTTHSIPAACGLYYFEVKIVSKGRDGYMGIGLSAHGVNVNRLPGWDKHSYGYHGDDGHSFCSSGTGQPYGPTFTTGDVIGCGVNLVDNTAFYTKNGCHLGIAFTDLPVRINTSTLIKYGAARLIVTISARLTVTSHF